jgi:hypothetical protein
MQAVDFGAIPFAVVGLQKLHCAAATNQLLFTTWTNLMKLPSLCSLLLAVLTVGCTSTSTSNTARTAKEQMLVSNAIDQSLDKVDFSPVSGQKVFLDDKYLDCVDKGYVMGSLRHRLLRAGANVVATAEESDVILEPRSGGVGTDTTDSFIGIPEITLPGMMTFPEIRFSQKKSQFAYAKIGLVLYDTKSRSVLGDGGISMAQASDSNTFVLGIGPWTGGTLKRDLATAQRLPHGMGITRLPDRVTFSPPSGNSSLRYASDGKPATVSDL